MHPAPRTPPPPPRQPNRQPPDRALHHHHTYIRTYIRPACLPVDRANRHGAGECVAAFLPAAQAQQSGRQSDRQAVRQAVRHARAAWGDDRKKQKKTPPIGSPYTQPMPGHVILGRAGKRLDSRRRGSRPDGCSDRFLGRPVSFLRGKKKKKKKKKKKAEFFFFSVLRCGCHGTSVRVTDLPHGPNWGRGRAEAGPAFAADRRRTPRAGRSGDIGVFGRLAASLNAASGGAERSTGMGCIRSKGGTHASTASLRHATLRRATPHHATPRHRVRSRDVQCAATIGRRLPRMRQVGTHTGTHSSDCAPR